MRGKLIAGKYELEALVGQGGMGSVWRAIDRTLHRPVAVKLMAPRHRESEAFRERFESEARALASLKNPHVVQIYDYGVEDEVPYIVMELLDGESLEARLQREAPLSPKAVLELLRQITSGLAAAASLRMVHRDLKPENVFIVHDAKGETAKLLDFGLAWMRTAGAVDKPDPETKIVGTPAYMSPEGLRGHLPDVSHDLWAVGVITYKALTGQMPFTGRYLGKLIVSVCTDPAQPPSTHIPALGPHIDAFFVQALAKDPSRRFRSAAEFLDAFTEASRAVQSTKILAVDDEPDMRELLELRFRREIRDRQFEFVFADNGVSALEQLDLHPDIDVVLADINMPGMNGLELLARLSETAPHARTVMVSAYSDMANIRQAMNSGAFDFVVKPIDFVDLKATIEKTARAVLDQRELAASEQENRLLRRLIPAATAERIHSLGPAALVGNEVETGTVLYMRLPESAVSVDAEIGVQDALRELNARFELALPEIERGGGRISLLLPDAVAAYFVGRIHVQRALDACRRVMRAMRSLAELAGPESPYAHGLSIGLSSGPLILACIGSHVVGRLSPALLGATLEHARALALAARPDEVLAPGVIGTSEGLRSFFAQLEARQKPDPIADTQTDLQTVYAFDWGREPPTPEGQPHDPTDPESTLSVADIRDDGTTTGSIELGALALGWTLDEI